MSIEVYGRTWTHMQCGTCGIEWLTPAKFHEEHLETGETFYCPNGHQRVYRTTTAQILETTRKDLGEAIAARDKAEAEVLRLKKRQRNGVCTFCNRSFTNVRHHMATKHMGQP